MVKKMSAPFSENENNASRPPPRRYYSRLPYYLRTPALQIDFNSRERERERERGREGERERGSKMMSEEGDCQHCAANDIKE